MRLVLVLLFVAPVLAEEPSLASRFPAGPVVYVEGKALGETIDAVIASPVGQAVSNHPGFQEALRTPKAQQLLFAQAMLKGATGMDLRGVARALCAREFAAAVYGEKRAVVLARVDAPTSEKLFAGAEILSQKQRTEVAPAAAERAALWRLGRAYVCIERDLLIVSSDEALATAVRNRTAPGVREATREARGLGVLFVRIPPGEKPVVRGEGKAESVRCFDQLLNRRIEVPTDLVVLSVGMRPRQPETHVFHEMLKASVGLDGFFLERHPELAPVETVVDGVFLAGTVQGPKDVVDSVAQASAAAAKAATILAFDSVKLEPAVATVNQIRCRACGKCVEVCPFNAASLDETAAGIIAASVNASLCKGCGTCASWCPSGAIAALHFTDRQVHAMIDAVFAEEGA